MLLRFGVSNYLSMRNRQELSLVASRGIKDSTSGLLHSDQVSKLNILPYAVLYGPNASGKSNIIKAIRDMTKFISASNLNEGLFKEMLGNRFALDSSNVVNSIIFDVDFIFEGVRYSYGFALDDDGVECEWLYAYPNGVKQVYFEREKGAKFRFGRALKGKNHLISELTREDALFLSVARQMNHDELIKVSRFFESIEFFSFVNGYGFEEGNLTGIEYMGLMDSDIDKRAIEFLNQIGTGIVDYRRKRLVKPKEVEVIEKFFNEFFKDKKGMMARVASQSHVIEMVHLAVDGSRVCLPFSKESAGTQRLLGLLTKIFKIVDEGGVVFVDEVDASLHTFACDMLLRLFSNANLNEMNSQMVATTHDTNLLNTDDIRRDQVWFVEKGAGGDTALYPLTEIYSRKGDDIERGYLQGRYGAVPTGSRDVGRYFEKSNSRSNRGGAE